VVVVVVGGGVLKIEDIEQNHTGDSGHLGVWGCAYEQISQGSQNGFFWSFMYSILVASCFVQTLSFILVKSCYLSYCFLAFFFSFSVCCF
jgi:hypothetical protein